MKMSADTTLTMLRRDALEVPTLAVRASTPAGEVSVGLGMRPVVIGSAPECDLVVADPGVSRQHCSFVLGERGIEVADLGSKNGTFVRDVSVLRARLELGAPVTIGGTRIVVQAAGAPALVPLSLSASFGEAIGGGLVMRALFAQLERIAGTDATVCLRGETGSGKELLARAIHGASARRAAPFEVLDCAAIAPTMLEAELFGWERGAFTGAVESRDGALVRAGGGTLFLDSIDELAIDVQPALLRALDAKQVRPIGANHWREVDTRIICSSHADLRQRVGEGAFREDLFYRIAVVMFEVPALRQRKDDIPLLVERFLSQQQPPRSLDDLPPGAMSLLLAHDWPGNVRELWNTVARLVMFPDIESELRDMGAPQLSSATALTQLTLRDARALVVEQFERHYLTSKLREHAGNVSRAAEAIGVSRQFLHRLLDRYGISREPGW
jgi:DNA-binding NtrC family response regulator